LVHVVLKSKRDAEALMPRSVTQIRRAPWVNVYLLGTNYRTVSIDRLGHLALEVSRIPALLHQLAEVVEEAVVLSTCNRCEIYFAAESDVTSAVHDVFSAAVATDPTDSETYSLAGTEAVRHLLGVAAGLDSMVLGEPQILGQVGGAWELANRAGCTGPTLNTLFRFAQQAGKDVRSHTRIAHGATSVAHAAVEIARRHFSSLHDRTVLVLGAGKTGRAAALNLRAAGAGALHIANRTHERAETLASQIGGVAIPFAALSTGLATADLLLACAAAPSPLVSRTQIEQVMADRPDRPLLVLDIAVPRDIEAEARDVAGVSLYDMDDINHICEQNRHARVTSARLAEKYIAEWTRRFGDWQRERHAVPRIRHFRAKAETMRAAEVERTLKALPELNGHQRAAIEALSRALSQKLLHEPTIWLRKHGETFQARADHDTSHDKEPRQ
jgi:glutamyl-tRNA reductase